MRSLSLEQSLFAPCPPSPVPLPPPSLCHHLPAWSSDLPRTLKFRKGPSPTQIEAPGHPHPSFVPIPGGPVLPGRCCQPASGTQDHKVHRQLVWEAGVTAPSAPRLFPPPVCGTRKLWELGDTTPQGVYLPQGVVTVTQRCSQARMLADASIKLAERE